MSTFDILHKIKKGIISIFRKRWKRYFYWMKRLLDICNYNVYIIGVPEHTNLGDSAIAVAEIEFLKKCGINEKKIKCITEPEFRKDFQIIKKYISKNSLICLLGGGNMGNQWKIEEESRRKMLAIFSDNPCIIFPQTLYYCGKNKEKDERDSIPYYINHHHLTMIAREKQSYVKMKELYSNINILLTPDIVLSTTMHDWGVIRQKRKDVLFCIREDEEKQVDNVVWKNLEVFLLSKNMNCSRTDMHSTEDIIEDKRRIYITDKMQQFCSAQLVITDRLHGMIFAAITGTPCIVFNNYNYKIKGTYDWISYLKYIKYVETIEEAKSFIPSLLEMNECQYDLSPLIPYFTKISQVIKELCL